MLVLSRKKNQSIVIDGGIEIQVLQLKGGTVKIGISAPNDVRIVRGELDMYSDMISIDEGRPKSAEIVPHVIPDDSVREAEQEYTVCTYGVVPSDVEASPIRNRVVAR